MPSPSDSILYIETDIPARMTCADYKRARGAGRRSWLRGRLLRRRAARVR